MEDEIDQESMDEEVGEPKKAKDAGSPLKMIVILGVMLVAAVILVFFGPLKFILGGEPEETEEALVIEDIINVEYGVEYIVPEVIHTMLDDRGKVRNLVINATFETSQKLSAELARRIGLTKDVIKGQFSNFQFKEILDPAVQDSLQLLIRNEINRYLPIDKDNIVRRVFLQIVTM